jgi:4-amino-4-deoxy-L-arabinose transferase-like glycosyltransferase
MFGLRQSDLSTDGPLRPIDALRSDKSLAALVSNLERREGILFGALLMAYAGLVLALGLGRSHLGYGVETDFVGGYVPEAQRFLDGEPLLSEFHPPLYPLALAGLRELLDDWLLAGVVLSALSGIAVLIASYFLFYDLGGRATAWGAVVTLLGSGVFIQSSASASTDVAFLALFMGSCLCAIRALRSGSTWLWRGCGLLAGLAIATRSNGVALGLLILAPLLSQAPLRSRLGGALHVATGLAVPAVVLLIYAVASGSNVWPSRNHLNLAMTYFAGGDRTSREAMHEVAGHFSGVADVLLHDPASLARTYAYDLYKVLSEGLTKVAEPPLYLFFLPGLLFLVGRRLSAGLSVLLLIAAAQLLLVNFKAFQPRFYLFLVPIMGAAVGEMAWRVLHADWPPERRRAIVALFGLMLVAAAVLATVKAYRALDGQVNELADVLPVVVTIIPQGSAVLARKPHLAFYTDAQWTYLPDLADPQELHGFLRRQEFNQPAYLFYGKTEREYRPQYPTLKSAEAAPDWLEVVVESSAPGNWILYRYDPERGRDGSG